MLKTRLLTISFLLPAILGIILYCPTILVSVISAIIFMLATWEWTKLIGIEKPVLQIAYLGVIISLGVACKVFNFPVIYSCIVAMFWWFISLFAIIFYPKGVNIWSNSCVGCLVGLLLFVPAWLSIDWLHAVHNLGPVWVTFLCFLVWGADVGGYIIGRLWGEKKLAERVSAGKTWLGVCGAFLFAFAVVLVFKNFWLQTQKLSVLCLLGFIVVFFAIIGDLAESLFKRIRGVKDSGNLLPGHGGVLDRIDGLLAAVPTFIVGFNFLQI